MRDVFDNSLYVQAPDRFEKLSQNVSQFRGAYSGNNIIQDDIFNVMENYSEHQGWPFELFKIPVKDEELCACTFLREGRIFVMINSDLILAKQIFAAAHELYHIYCYFEEDNLNLPNQGSILKSSSMDVTATKEEDIEANAFAALLLVPSVQLMEQIKIYGIHTEKIELADILTLVEIFAIPYKAMVLRLYEERYIKESKARDLIDIPEDKIKKQIDLTGKGKRWYHVPSEKIEFGSLLENFELNKELDVLNESRMQSDEARITELQKILNGN